LVGKCENYIIFIDSEVILKCKIRDLWYLFVL